jgi:branched-chain amino acid transport system substrate-binding protein
LVFNNLREEVDIVLKWASVVFLVALLVFCLVGCAQEIDETAVEPIKIGVVTPMSPPGDTEGGQVNLNVANLAAKMINDEGGILGRPLELVLGDCEGTPAVGAAAVERIITQDKVSAIVGVWHSSVAVAQSLVADQYKVPMFVHYSFTDEVTEAHSDYVFRLGPFNSRIAEQMVQFMKERDYEHVALIVEDSAWGIGFGSALSKGLSEINMKATERIYPAESVDLTPILLEYKAMTPVPDCLLVCAAYQAAYILPTQATELGLLPDADLINGYDIPGWSPEWWPNTGEAGLNVMYPGFYSKDYLTLSPSGEKFQKAFMDEHGYYPPVYAFFLFDAMMLIKQAIEDTDSDDPVKIAEALIDIEFEGTTGTITFDRIPDPGPVWNCWTGQQMFMKQLTEIGQTDADAETVYIF